MKFFEYLDNWSKITKPVNKIYIFLNIKLYALQKQKNASICDILNEFRNTFKKFFVQDRKGFLNFEEIEFFSSNKDFVYKLVENCEVEDEFLNDFEEFKDEEDKNFIKTIKEGFLISNLNIDII